MSQERLRVRFFHAYPHQYAGAQRITELLAVELGARGHDVGVLLPDEGPFPERLRAAGIPVGIVRAPGIWRRYGRALEGPLAPVALAALPAYWVRLAVALRRIRPTLLHCNDHRGVLLAGPAARLARVPVVWHLHGAYGPAALNVLGGALAGRILVVSDATYREMPELARFEDRLSILHNGIRTGSAEPGAFHGAPLIACGARIHPEKGLDVLIRAVALLLPRFPGTRLCVAGHWQDGYAAHRHELTALVRELGLGEVVEFLGHVADPAPLWAAADVYVQPSRAEPFGLGILEAMAAGTPVVASAVGGIPEIVEAGVTGLLVRPDEPAELAAAIERAVDEPGLAERLTGAAGARVAGSFGVDAMVRKLLQAYADLDERGPAPAVAHA